MSEFPQLSGRGAGAKPELPFPFHKTRLHPSPKAAPGAVPTLFWPALTFFLSISVSLICWAAYNALPQLAGAGEKHLRDARFSSKVNATSAAVTDVDVPELLPEPERDAPAVVHNIIGEPLFLPPPDVDISTRKPTAEPPLLVPTVEVGQVELPKVELPLVEVPLALVPPPVPLPPQLPSWPPLEIEPAKLTVPEPPPVQLAETNPLIYREPKPGDTPMLRNWQTLALCSLMTTTFVQVAAPAVAGEQAKKDQDKTLLERIDGLQDTIKKRFDALQADMKDIKDDFKSQKESLKKVKDDSFDHGLGLAAATNRIKSLEGALESIRSDLNALREPGIGKPGVDKAGVEDIKFKLGAIEQAILKLLPPTNRISLASPSSSTTGRVMLVNLYPEELLFVVNQKSYRVLPGANMPLDNVGSGALSYEVISPTWGLRARNATTLNPNETFTLTAR